MPRLPRRPFGRQRPSVSDDHPSSGDLTREELVNELCRVIDLFEAVRSQDAVKRLRPLAQAGYQGSGLLLSTRYFEQGHLEAAELLLWSVAAEGQAKAMYLVSAISRCLHHDKAAGRSFTAESARGDADCMFDLGICAIGDGDLGSAKFWLGHAAVADSTDAMVNLGGLLLKEDLESALPMVEAHRRQGAIPQRSKTGARTSEAAG